MRLEEDVPGLDHPVFKSDREGWEQSGCHAAVEAVESKVDGDSGDKRMAGRKRVVTKGTLLYILRAARVS